MDAKLFENVLNVVADRDRADTEAIGNGARRHPLPQASKDFSLSPRKALERECVLPWR